ncbi:alpha/beta-hydrolase [Conidiobolus coronatus NRRL 28638]|uniref:Dipeptidyl-peptidase V n=1 Tax=Conidiobolus coronatus (strain ATCC 28846 / CBS 209.66 / NRRL 28638) TaxID=796925 RepID=A0A137P1N2_CONC2|nr:alpha/beta-hydrolase [Conidiobolus coronatus NRRL 28638]|eukprot:KXN68953.1 alpha/beta-hydrolase [Conidiobolus coronatus NRRL 28638]
MVDFPDKDKKFDTALVYDELLMRHWNHWNTREKSHLFTLNITPSGAASGQPKDLLKGTNLESPVEYTGGPFDYVVSPDGKWVSFGAKKPGRDKSWETEQNIHLVSFDGSGAIADLTQDNQGASTHPLFSPCGKYLTWFQMKRRGYEADRNDIILFDLEKKVKREIANDWDRSPSSNLWSLDSKSLLLTAVDEAKTKLFRVDIESGKVTKFDTPNSVSTVSQVDSNNLLLLISSFGHPNEMFTLADKDTLLLTISSFGHPNDIYSIGVDGKNLNQLTDANSEKLKGIYLAEPEEFWFTGALGDNVQGWLLKPINFDPSKKYPVAVIIHGGPQSSYKDRYFQYHNFNLHASAGQAVVSINYHGSKGFGQNFTDSVNKNYETYPVEDHYKGLDHLIKKYSWIDGDRVCTAGTSMGGYYGNWFNGHTKRFKCFIQGDGDFDLKQDYFTTDELWFAEYDSGGSPMDPKAKYDESNPANFVGNWTTPTLVVHNQKDYRVDLSAGLATFTALQRQGVPSRFLYFPDESHGVSKPANLIRFMNETVGWVTKWTSKH